MVSAVVTTVRNVVGIIGNIISLFLFLSPVWSVFRVGFGFVAEVRIRIRQPTFIEIVKKGSVKQYSPAPYLATLINCMVWVLYGLPMVHPNSILVITINGFGIAIELVYIILFVIYSDKKTKRLKVLLVIFVELIFITIVTLLVLTLLHTTKQRSMAVGIICILFNIMMYASPLLVMKLVITTKSVEYMPFFLSLMSLANGVAWTTYAFLPFDQFIAIPNGLGTLFGLAQLILYACYYKSTKRQMATRQFKGDVDLSVVVVSVDSGKISSTFQNGHPSDIMELDAPHSPPPSDHWSPL